MKETIENLETIEPLCDTIDILVEHYETQYKTLMAKIDALRPLICVYTGKDLYLLRRRIQLYYDLAIDAKEQANNLRRMTIKETE